MADQALREFEVQMGLVTPETAEVAEAAKELGPAQGQGATAKQVSASRAVRPAEPPCPQAARAGPDEPPAPPAHRPGRRRCPTGTRRGPASWPSCTSPARPACSSCTATSTT